MPTTHELQTEGKWRDIFYCNQEWIEKERLDQLQKETLEILNDDNKTHFRKVCELLEKFKELK